MLDPLRGDRPARGGTGLICYHRSEAIKQIQFVGAQENITETDETPWAVFNYDQAGQIGGTQ